MRGRDAALAIGLSVGLGVCILWQCGVLRSQRDASDAAEAELPPLDPDASLFRAAEQGQASLVSRLLAANCDVDDSLEDGTTALIRAAELGHSDVVDVLLQHGADGGASRWDGCTAFLAAAQNGHEDVIARLQQQNSLHVPDPSKGGSVSHGGAFASAARAQGMVSRFGLD